MVSRFDFLCLKHSFILNCEQPTFMGGQPSGCGRSPPFVSRSILTRGSTNVYGVALPSTPTTCLSLPTVFCEMSLTTVVEATNFNSTDFTLAKPGCLYQQPFASCPSRPQYEHLIAFILALGLRLELKHLLAVWPNL
jgi:hypothetical protein